MIDLWLFLAKYVFLALLYLFLFWAVRVIAAETRSPVGERARGSRASLIIATDDGGERTVPLTGTIAIGRLPDNDIALEDTAVSGHHARIARRGDAWMLEDIGSSNGTFLNSRRLEGRTGLDDGDLIGVGRTKITVEIRGES